MAIQQGVNQQTAAAQNVWNSLRRTVKRGVKRRVKKAVKSATKRASSKRSTGKKARLVKGSAAAKRYMAKIRKLRK